MNKPSVTIIGNGRFGKTLYNLLKDDFSVTIYTRKGEITPEEAYKNNVIFYAVPIAAFEDVIKSHKKFFRPDHVLIDVLSVKLHPAKIFTKYLKNTKTQALLTHPMFGPDSSKNGFENLPLIMDQFKTTDETYQFWKDYFQKKQLRVLEMSADEHDKLSAHSLGLVHFIGRILGEYNLKPTSIDSMGTKRLLQVKEQVCNDRWQLFTDMQNYNPHSNAMLSNLRTAYETVQTKLNVSKPKNETVTYAIQGGKGSFNDEAIHYYLKKNNITTYKILYLYTTKNVLRSLSIGESEYGQFAIHNAQGGMVTESIQAMGKDRFSIVEEFAIKISHSLMIRKDITLDAITTVMSHPQGIAQCKMSLDKKYPQLKQKSETGELIDTALVAKEIAEGNLPKTTAVLGSKILAEMYNFQIIENDLQDLQDNFTSFLLVER